MIETNSSLSPIIRRIIVVSISLIVAVLFCYACNAYRSVSSFKLDIESVLGRAYTTEKQDIVLVFNAIDEASITTADQENSGTYLVHSLENVIFLTNGEGENAKKFAFIPLSEQEILWQTKNILLFQAENL